MLNERSRRSIGKWLMGKLLDSSPEFRKSLQLLPWLPFLFTFLGVFVVTLFAEVIGYGIFYANAVVTYGKLMEMLLVAVGLAVFIGFVARFQAQKRIEGEFGVN